MKLTLKEKRQETSDCTSFIFEPEEAISYKGGQFFQYTIEDPQSDDRGTKRFFTNAAAPFEQKVMITTRFASEKGSTFKANLEKMEVGQTIDAKGPFGEFTLDEIEKSYIFIAGGIGITPFRSILLQLDHDKQPLNVTLLYANRNQEVVFKEELDSLAAKHSDFKVHYIIDPQRIDTQTLQSLISNLQTPIYYLSGPKPLVQAMEQTLAKLNIPSEQIKTDYFPGYSE
jgi:ferredoxin-NADP reductase